MQLVKKGQIKRLKNSKEEEKVEGNSTEYKTIYHEVVEGLKEEGVKFHDNMDIDETYLDLPRYLDQEPLEDILRYMNVFTQQRMFQRTLQIKYRALLREAEFQLASERERVWGELPAKMSLTEKENKLYVDEKASKILTNLTILQEKCFALEATMKNLEDGIFLLSRELTRRGFDINSFNRMENVGNQRRG